MSGLYQRALYILNKDNKSSTQLTEGITFDSDSGIPIEDQREILTEIERIVSQNRIKVDNEILKLKPEKRGILFPILINSIGVIFTIGIFLIFQWFFSQQVQQIQLDAQLYSGGDSKLISNIKKEAEERLNAKEQEINLIQKQLQNLDSEKEKLQENMDAEIEKRNQELELEMQRTLDQERQRLKDQGISTEDIDAQIEKIKKQKELENIQELESYKEQAETERIEQEKRLEQLEDAYKQDLNGLNSEKVTLEKDLEEKEKELREYEESQKELEQEKTEAEKRLKEMDEQKKKADQLNNQIRGMYETINTQMQERNYAQALQSLEEMRGFFYDKTTATLPGILERRDVELFIIDSLENLVRREVAKTEIDTATLVEKANLITNISAKVNEAEQLYRQKNFTRARQLYEEALAIIPEIEQSYTNLSAIEASQKNTLFSQYFTEAESSYNTQKYSDAVNLYKKAIKLYPDEGTKVDTMISRILEAGYRLRGDKTQIAEDEKKANQLLSKASQALRDGEYGQAIDKYVEIITYYSRTTQVNSARNGINTAVTREREEFLGEMEATIKEKDKTIAEKDALLQEKDDLISEMDKTDVIASITKKVKEADKLYEKDDTAGAKKKYLETLSIIPEIEKSHNTIELIDDATQNQLFIQYVTEANNAYDTNNYKKTIDAYTSAIKLFPKDQTLIDAMILRIMESGYKLQGDPAVIALEEYKAHELIIKASGELNSKNYKNAIDTYIDILLQYPRTSKAASAEKGLRVTIDREKTALLEEQETTSGDENTEITRLKTVEKNLTEKITALEKENAEMKAELITLRQEVEKTEATVATQEPSPGPSEPPAEGTIPAITHGEDEVIISKKELEEYNNLKEQISVLKDRYIQYANEEDRVIEDQGTIGYLRTKTILGDILNSEFAKEIFPDLYERIKKFDVVLAEDAREDGHYIAVDNILNIIYNRLTLETESDSSEYWNELRTEYEDDDIFLELIDELEDLMEEQ